MGEPAVGRRGSVVEKNENTTSSLAPAVMVATLQQLFGQKLTAFLAGINDPKEVGRWARGEARPSPVAARRLADAHSIVQLMQPFESPRGICAWFLGMNPVLDDRAPAEVLGEDPDLVRGAANALIATG